MPSVATLSALDAVFKELYDAKKPENVANRNHVFLSQVPKRGDFYGDVWRLPIVHGNPQGRAQVFGTAQQNASASSQKAFMIQHARDYAYTTLDALAMLASKSNRGAFLETMESQADGLLAQLGNSLAAKLYSDGNNQLGRCANDPADANGTITLTNADDAKNFQVGMRFVAAASASGTSPRSGSATVSSVNEDAGTISFTGTITGITTNDFLFVRGDDGAALTAASQQRFFGLAAWLPLTAPTGGDNFWTVDRSVDTIRLAGNRLDQGTQPIKESILHVAERCFRHGGRPDRCYLNPTNFTALAKDLGVKIEYQKGGGTADYGFETIRIHTSAGPVEVYGDPDCPIDRGYVLDLSTWELKYLGPGIPHWVTDDGGKALRLSDDDGVEMRCRYYGNLGCRAPAHNGVFSIA